MSVCEDEKIGGRDGVVGEGVGEIAAAAHFVRDGCWVTSTAVVAGELVAGCWGD